MRPIVFLCTLLLTIGLHRCAAPTPPPSERPAVWIDTDLGGDPDDIQSLFRLLHYSDLLEIKGIVATPCVDLKGHPWDTLPRVPLIREWIQRVDLDHLRAQGYPELMAESELLSRVYLGSERPGTPDPSHSSDGSARLIAEVQRHSPEAPLWVLVWGSLTTVAQALHDAPEIAPRLRIYSIGSTNTQHDSLARDYVYRFMIRQYPALWWIENGILPKWSHETFRGVYQGGEQSGEWGNEAFISQHIRGHGSTHAGLFAERCGDAFPTANWPKGRLKEGDSPSILYLLSPPLGGVGDLDDPTQPSWGGRFRRADSARFPNYFVDLDLPPDSCQATISRWRVAYLSDWKARWDRYGEGN
ncbi:MAG: DUF1593 domain-containing protein [Bacteroidetes bacterium]|nr:MAG: DUF1593 domain-containing protein [Bacteroidota bacterium]